MVTSNLPLSTIAAGDPTTLAAQARRGDPQAAQAVAAGLESLFASLLIKQMRQTLEPETMFGNDSGDVLGGLFDYTLGQHLAQSGSLGIGRLLQQQLTQRGPTT